jgi:hypothetical protein
LAVLRKRELSKGILKILLAAGSIAALTLGLLAPAVWADNPPSGDSVGTIEGESISVEGPMSVESVRGQVKTMLRSGSDVHVKAGQARIELIEGGSITICGPAHFSVLKSRGSLTVALDSGTIHALIEGSLALTVYTPQIQARPLAIGGGAQDVLAGLDSSGAMCLRAGKGAVRVEQQLTGQSVLIPQGGDVTLANGQLESLHDTAGKCACEMMQTTIPSTVSTQVSGLGPKEESKKAALPKPAAATAAAADPPQKTDEPVYQVFMPPLHYDASAKTQPAYDPKLIVLVRRARVRSALIFQGRVEGDPVVAQVALPQPPPLNSQKADAAKKPEDDSTWNRVRSFFHKLWSPSS